MIKLKLIAKRDFEVIRNSKVICKIEKDKEYIANYYDDTEEFFINENKNEILVAELLDNKIKVDEDFKLIESL
ncbi:hypothetical protein ACV30B_16690 [Clostridium perfringens]|uniref:Uncharacterized protein n=2 Tax=Clostridium perfringens TaxID=1502 RepID=A0AAN5SFZ8_CLOPF|nr:hypothetical protein [Clostridium perfringens]EIA17468.1 hypothetical protein HA1_06482 [Clostridium perfringens F262]MDM0592776.1 hypothetical protein [Clostridium perfringens]MDM0595775.1 hypothetical protein [Clostridium perfringens]MDU1256344.1 hypothetical protein [Clostridium perfringens]PWX45434.1 hypothetical protein CYK72_15385 [Clostridium perfringens]